MAHRSFKPLAGQSRPPLSLQFFVNTIAIWIFAAQSVFAIAPNQLGIKINDGLAAKGKYAYGVMATFQDNIQTDWSNEQISYIAKQAYEDMQNAFNTDRKTYPQLAKSGVVTVIAKGHTAYISSSLVGGDSLFYVPRDGVTGKSRYTPGVFKQSTDAGVVEWALMQCEVSAMNAAGHQRGANCGEPMAALMFVNVYGSGVLDGAKVVTWGQYKDRNNNNAKVTGVMDPCHTGQMMANSDTWGCAEFASKLGLTVIGQGTQATDTQISSDQPAKGYPCYT